MSILSEKVGPRRILISIEDRLRPEHGDRPVPDGFKRYTVMVNGQVIRRVRGIGTARSYTRIAAAAIRAADNKETT